MATFGGVFDLMDKEFPGSYVVTKSASRNSSTFGERGVVAIGLELDWGKSGVQKITKEELRTNGSVLFGYEFADAKMQAFRELLAQASTVYVYRLNDGGVKATSTIGKITYTAKHAGVKGNSIKVIVEADIDTAGNYIVKTLVDNKVVDIQSVKNVEDLVGNAYIDFSGTGVLAETDVTAGAVLSGGTNSAVTSSSHASFLEAIEGFDFNTIAYAGVDEEIKSLYIAFATRLRAEGVLFQAVLYNKNADNEGIVSVKNKAIENEAGIVYFVAGALAGCEIQNSCTNLLYTGEYTIESYSKTDMVKFARLGHLLFNVEDGQASILEDVNTLVTFTEIKGRDYSKNQVVRVLDQRAKDVAKLFDTRYKGKIVNTEDGRASLWGDLVTKAKELQRVGAVEDYSSEDTKVYAGGAKDSVVIVDGIKPTMAMQKLYATISIN